MVFFSLLLNLLLRGADAHLPFLRLTGKVTASPGRPRAWPPAPGAAGASPALGLRRWVSLASLSASRTEPPRIVRRGPPSITSSCFSIRQNRTQKGSSAERRPVAARWSFSFQNLLDCGFGKFPRCLGLLRPPRPRRPRGAATRPGDPGAPRRTIALSSPRADLLRGVHPG